jgi:hypothetical protein
VARLSSPIKIGDRKLRWRVGDLADTPTAGETTAEA